jgi:hypothetical protein
MSPRRATRKPPRPQLQVQVVALMRRGEVWVARLNPNQGAEVGKVRPVVAAALASLQLLDPARTGLGSQSGSSCPGTDV